MQRGFIMTKERRLPSGKILALILVMFVVIMFSFILLLELPIQLALLTIWFMIMAVGSIWATRISKWKRGS